MRHRACLAATLLFASLGFASLALPVQAGLYNPAVTTLANGLRVVVVENHRAPLITQMVWVGAGSADEVPGVSGIAHYLEHLMFKGTHDVPNGRYSAEIAEKGGNDNAFTSTDYTAYLSNVAKEQLPLVMRLEADRFAHIQFDPALAKPELAVVLNEKLQRVDSSPGAPLNQQMMAMLFANHPYSHPTIGWQEEIETLRAADAQAFYQRWYHPAAMTVVISGDVVPAEVFKLAAQTYGQIPAGPLPPRLRPQAQAFHANTVIERKDGRVQEVSVLVYRRAPSRRLDASRAVALEVLQEVLDGSEAAYLPNLLVKEKKLATGVEVGYDADAYDEGLFSIALTPRPKVTPEQVLAALDAGLAAFAPKPVAAATLEAAKTSLQRQALLQRDSVVAPAYAFGTALSTGGTVADVEAWPEKVAAVTAAQVQQVMQALLAQATVTGVLRPDPDAPPAPPVPASAGPLSGGPLR